MYLSIFLSMMFSGCSGSGGNGANANIVSYTAELEYNDKCKGRGCPAKATIHNIPDGFIWKECTCVMQKTFSQDELEKKEVKQGYPFMHGYAALTPYYSDSSTGTFQNVETKKWQFVVNCSDSRVDGITTKAACVVVYK